VAAAAAAAAAAALGEVRARAGWRLLLSCVAEGDAE
jgi:hypothetical protein